MKKTVYPVNTSATRALHPDRFLGYGIGMGQGQYDSRGYLDPSTRLIFVDAHGNMYSVAAHDETDMERIVRIHDSLRSEPGTSVDKSKFCVFRTISGVVILDDFPTLFAASVYADAKNKEIENDKVQALRELFAKANV